MGQGVTRSGYFVFTGKGEIFQSQYGEGKIRKHYFKRCEIENGEIVFKDLERYQMYVPVGDSKFNFDERKIYELSEVSHGAGKEDISGTINLSHHIYPIELTHDEFKEAWEKNKNRKKINSPELLNLIKEIDKKDRDDIDKRFGRHN